MNANLETLAKIHGKDKAEAAFREIADLGGFGPVGTAEGQIHPSYAGGLDVAGVLAESNTAVGPEAKARIAELTGVDRKAADALIDGGQTTSSADKMKKDGK